jgi:5'-3' exonuclease
MALSFNGQKTGIIFGFFRKIMDLSVKFDTNLFVFAWDSKKSLRKLKYDWYKLREERRTEKEKRELELALKQFNKLKKEILYEIGFRNIYMQTGYEADDVIASLVIHNKKDFIVVSGDEDLYQLLDHCSIYIPRKDKLYTKDDFIKQYKIKPKQWVDVKMLGGCTSDKIPGISGIGEGTAVMYLRGEMKDNSKRYKAITDNTAKYVTERNKWLVELPLPDTKQFSIVKDDLNFDAFLKMCHNFSFQLFLKNENLDKWKKFFNQKVKKGFGL